LQQKSLTGIMMIKTS